MHGHFVENISAMTVTFKLSGGVWSEYNKR
jgi:hypothetical protein